MWFPAVVDVEAKVHTTLAVKMFATAIGLVHPLKRAQSTYAGLLRWIEPEVALPPVLLEVTVRVGLH